MELPALLCHCYLQHKGPLQGTSTDPLRYLHCISEFPSVTGRPDLVPGRRVQRWLEQLPGAGLQEADSPALACRDGLPAALSASELQFFSLLATVPPTAEEYHGL